MKPWYITKKQLWVCKYKRKRVYLFKGKNTKLDRAKALKIMKEKCPTLLDVRLGEYQKLPLYAEFYKERVRANFKSTGWRTHLQIVNGFVERWKKVDIVDLLPLHLQTWLTEKEYGANKWNSALAVILRLFNWGVQQGILSKNPVHGVRHKPRVMKSLDCVITEEQHTALMNNTGHEGRRILTALYETGCRPSELRRVRKHHYHPEIRAWVFSDEESKTKNRKVYLSKTMVDMTEKLIAHDRDFLFRNPSNNLAWKDPNGTLFGEWFRRLTRRAKVESKDVTSYSYRHRFATNLILKDVGMKKIAELLGHTNIRTVEYWYVHLRGNHQALAEVLDSISG